MKGKQLITGLSIGVVVYVIMYMFLVLLYCTPQLLVRYTAMDVTQIPNKFEFPLEIYSCGLIAICAGYAGIDLGVQNKLFKMKQSDTIDYSRIIFIIVLLTLVVAESTFLHFKLCEDYTKFSDFGNKTYKGIKLPLFSTSFALVTACVTLLVGDRLISINNVNSLEEIKEDEKEDDSK